MPHTYAELSSTPIGTISFAAGEGGLERVAFSSLIKLKDSSGIQDNRPSLRAFEVINALLFEVKDYLIGLRQSICVDINWHVMNDFQRAVLEVVNDIPFGSFLTYGAVAAKLGKPGSARAVGRALASNPMPIVIPCHRVIAADKRLNGYLGGMEVKAFLLTLEGHQVKDDQLLKLWS